MRFEFDQADLKPLVAAVVSEVLEQVDQTQQRLGNGRLAYTEQEAAQLLGIPRHSLRDLRLRGLVKASKLGVRIVYSKEQLVDLLARQQMTP